MRVYMYRCVVLQFLLILTTLVPTDQPSSSALGDLADNLNVSQVIFTQLIMKLTLQEVHE